jgi:hypothetical protein
LVLKRPEKLRRSTNWSHFRNYFCKSAHCPQVTGDRALTWCKKLVWKWPEKLRRSTNCSHFRNYFCKSVHFFHLLRSQFMKMQNRSENDRKKWDGQQTIGFEVSERTLAQRWYNLYLRHFNYFFLKILIHFKLQTCQSGNRGRDVQKPNDQK